MLANLDISKFVTISVTIMSHMLDNYNSLRTLSISNFNISKVNDI